MRSLVAALVLIPCSVLCADYEVSFDASSSSALVRVRLTTGTATEFAMPAWSPGDYRIVNYGRHVRDVSFTHLGEQISHTKKGTNNWVPTSPADTVTYRVSTQRAGLFSENFRLTANEAFVHGPAVFGYFLGRTNEEQRLNITPYPRIGAAVAIGLTEKERYNFIAKNYDELIDSPFAIGSDVRIVDFTVGGRRHQVAAFGPQGRNASPTSYVSLLTKIVGEGRTMFGELPYDKYVFLMDFGGDGGGLEHANSSRMAMWLGDPGNAAEFLAHEYFHAFNVKRIRPRPLGPFDYSQQAVTGSLWWLEGVTDYYAEVLLVRGGVKTREQAMRSLSSELRAVNRNPERLRVSADESSRRVWESNNSAGFGINYYTKGKVIGWVLDLAIRGETDGKRSLDDVVLALYNETKGGKPGYSETRIRELCIEIGGPALGPIYDDAVMKAVELPISATLPKMGMHLVEGIVRDNPASQTAAGSAWPARTQK